MQDVTHHSRSSSLSTFARSCSRSPVSGCAPKAPHHGLKRGRGEHKHFGCVAGRSAEPRTAGVHVSAHSAPWKTCLQSADRRPAARQRVQQRASAGLAGPRWQGRGQERAWRRAAARGSRAWRRVCGCGRARGGRTHVVRHAHAAGEGSVQADVAAAAPVHFENKLPRSVVTTQLNTKTIAAATQDHQQGHPLEVGTGKSPRRKRRAVREAQRARAAPARWTQRCNAR